MGRKVGCKMTLLSPIRPVSIRVRVDQASSNQINCLHSIRQGVRNQFLCEDFQLATNALDKRYQEASRQNGYAKDLHLRASYSCLAHILNLLLTAI